MKSHLYSIRAVRIGACEAGSFERNWWGWVKSPVFLEAENKEEEKHRLLPTAHMPGNFLVYYLITNTVVILLLYLFYRWCNWDSQELRGCFKVIKLISGDTKIKTKFYLVPRSFPPRARISEVMGREMKTWRWKRTHIDLCSSWHIVGTQKIFIIEWMQELIIWVMFYLSRYYISLGGEPWTYSMVTNHRLIDLKAI